MHSPSSHDPTDFETRGLMLAKRLLRDEVRTDMVLRFSGIRRSQIAVLRRRLGIPLETRHRGPSPWRVATFVANADRRRESAALAALLAQFDLIDPQVGRPGRPLHRHDVGERLCEIREYVRNCFPEVDVDFEGINLLRTALLKRGQLETTHCRRCGCLIVIERFDRRYLICEFCNDHGSATGAKQP